MFKKLFGSLTGDDKQENQNHEAPETFNENIEEEYQEV